MFEEHTTEMLEKEIIRHLEYMTKLVPGDKEYQEAQKTLLVLLSLLDKEDTSINWKKIIESPAFIGGVFTLATTASILVFEARNSIMSSAFKLIRFK